MNTKKLAQAANICPYWLLSVTLLRKRDGDLPEWLKPYLKNRRVLWDPGTFSENHISYKMYLNFIDRHVKENHEYLQYDEIGSPEATEFYLNDMRRRGYNPIPVLQPGGFVDEPRMAVGGLVGMSQEKREKYLDYLFYQKKIKGKAHLLGMGQEKWFKKYPAISGDSTTWIPYHPYNRRKSIEEWLENYGEMDIEYEPPKFNQITLEV